ncbi:MAG TPA: anti-sigma factor domain-containing protein, partial [Anaerovoracaceae bacterium]|nr:anti-sigma factor domain-containing protein [Anaerovoracaceae bacterium]
MKGIVVENNNKDAVILTDDGLFSKVKNNKYEVGQTIDIKENKRTGSKLIAGAASMVAALAVCTVGAFAYYTPTDYVSLDVNPSVEYSVNVFDRILDVKAVNDDGEEILSSLDLNNMTI